MIHYKCKGCDNFVNYVCKPYWETEFLTLYEALEGVECKVLDNNSILYHVTFNVSFNSIEESLEMHVVKNNRKELQDIIDSMSNEIKKTYAEYDDFKIINTFIQPIIHKDGYYVELKKIED